MIEYSKLFIMFGAFLLSACVGSPTKNASPATIYDFGLPATRLVVDNPLSGFALEVRSPSWLDSTGMGYRLLYEDPLKRHEYANSRWAANPGQLLAQHLRQQLGVVAASGNVAAACMIRVELQEFSQVFDSSRNSRAVLLAELGLVGAKRQLIAAQQLMIEKPAMTGDASGGVKALMAASSELAGKISDWIAKEKSGTLQACR